MICGAPTKGSSAQHGACRPAFARGAAATEAAIRAVQGPRLLHLVTHGFFLADLPPDTFGVWREVSFLRLRDLPSWDAFRAGIALAGYNQRHHASDFDDGVLTAFELIDLDLVGTEVVVVSAYRTGVGGVRLGQGVFGIRRAPALAGARSQLTTLWSVDDAATRDLMVAWYLYLGDGMDRAEALRRAKLVRLLQGADSGEMRNGRGQQHRGACRVASGCRAAYLRDWAGFVLGGAVGAVDVSTDQQP